MAKRSTLQDIYSSHPLTFLPFLSLLTHHLTPIYRRMLKEIFPYAWALNARPDEEVSDIFLIKKFGI